ncbi:hypothetical protein BH10BAC2_BH10BAC2_38560 [soil metagenome]
MTRIIGIILSIFLAVTTFGQTKSQKIKVILLGTFHFGATSDRNSTKFPDLFSKERQLELDTIANALTNFGIDKFFLETEVSKQKWQDSLFSLYKTDKLTTQEDLSDERVQIAFRTAAKKYIPMIAADFKLNLPYDKINEYEEKHKNDTINIYPFFDIPYPFTDKRKGLKDLTLSKYYIQLNNKYSIQANLYDYLHYSLWYGRGDDYLGENVTAIHYDRNLKIFTNILRQINPKTDKTIVILFGSSHTTMLRQFFENHPVFEIVELESVLK